MTCPLAGRPPFTSIRWWELPEIPMDITHFRLFSATCRHCGRKVKGRIPEKSKTGYGPRFSALVAQLSGGLRGIPGDGPGPHPVCLGSSHFYGGNPAHPGPDHKGPCPGLPSHRPTKPGTPRSTTWMKPPGKTSPNSSGCGLWPTSRWRSS